jgi:glycosyltransferase involved in cell wall biosynthesis
LKILLITPGMFKLPLKGYGGIEVIVESLYKGYQKAGHEVAVVAPEGSELPEGVELIPTSLRGGEEAMFAAYADRMGDFDIIHDHTFQSWAYMGSIGQHPHLPIVKTLHTTPGNWTSAPDVPHPNLIGISRDHSRQAAMILGTPVKTVYNGIELDNYPLGAKTQAERNGRYLFMGRYTAEKGVLEAMGMAKKTKVGLDCYGDTVIIADQTYLDRCRRAADGILVRYNAGVSRADTAKFYRQYKALLTMPNWDEPFGMVFVEAMLSGLPVITLKRGSMPELVEHGVTGWVCEDEDEVEKTIRDNLVDQISPALCRRKAENFSAENMVAGYLKLFEEEVASTGGW